MEVGGSNGGRRAAEDVAINPDSLGPVVEDRGLALWESNAIVRYLSAR